jgi:nucleotide-binding universal stress UspA family protein
MNKLLLPVDDSKGARVGVQTFIRLFGARRDVSVLLLHVLQPGGTSLLHDRISDPELATLRRQLDASGKMERLERVALKILDHRKKHLQKNRVSRISTLMRFGHVADEIVKAAKEQKADLIILGSSRTLLQKLMMGDVVREVTAKANVPVLIAR